MVTYFANDGTGGWLQAESDGLEDSFHRFTQTLSGVVNVVGTAIRDVVYGDDESNRIELGAGNDEAFAGGGSDWIIGGSGEGDDLYDGGADADMVEYSSASASITVNLITGTASGAEIGNDTLISIENIVGGKGADSIVGNGWANVISGGRSDDSIIGDGGSDRLNGDAGNDTLVGGAGADHLNGGDGFDVADYSLEGGSGGISVNLLGFGPDDIVFALDSFGSYDGLNRIEGVVGTALADFIYGTNEANLVLGGDGNDQVVAWGGDDTVDGGAGDDVMLGWTGNDSLTGGANNDYLWAGDGADTALGGEGVDVLVGDLPGSAETGNDSLVGGLGEDILLGGAGNDTLVGGADSTAGSDVGARDWLVGGAGNDLMFGGSGDDVIWEQLDSGEGGNDTAFGGDGQDLMLTGIGADSIDGGAGNDTIYGGAGADTIATGTGSDLIWLTGVADGGDVVSDFTSGQDRMVVYPLLGGVVTKQQAFAQGILALTASGPNTLLRYDADGAGAGAPVTVATFLGLAPGGFNTASDFI